MKSTFVDLGFFQIRYYSILILTGMIIASYLINKEAKKKQLSEEDLTNILFYGIIIGILGARFHYVLFNLNYYLKKPLEIIMIWNGGLAIHGGIIAALIFLIIYCKKKKLKLLVLTDIIVVGLIIAQAIGRWGNFFNQEAYGRIVSLKYLKSIFLPKFIIEGMYINEFYREPTFLYESIACIIGFIILLLLRKYKNIKVGQLTGFYLTWYGFERLIVESFRSDSLMLGNIKVAQLISIISFFIGLYLIINIKNNKLYKKESVKL